MRSGALSGGFLEAHNLACSYPQQGWFHGLCLFKKLKGHRYFVHIGIKDESEESSILQNCI